MPALDVAKVCTACDKEKALSNFYKSKKGRFGVDAVCKKCRKIAYKIWVASNLKKIAVCKKAWQKANAERLKIYRKNNREKMRLYRIANREKRRLYFKAWRKKHPERITSTYRLNMRMSTGIRHSLINGKRGKHWETLVGYTLERLKKHLERQFSEGMSWELFLKGKIHLDHKIPVSVFNFTKISHRDFKRCWALSNLQPMWAKDNLAKGTKLTKHFQPSLKM